MLYKIDIEDTGYRPEYRKTLLSSGHQPEYTMLGARAVHYRNCLVLIISITVTTLVQAITFTGIVIIAF